MEVEIRLVIKKIQVLRSITFGNYSSLQKIQNSIEILRLKIFKSYSTFQKIQKYHFQEQKP